MGMIEDKWLRWVADASSVKVMVNLFGGAQIVHSYCGYYYYQLL